VYWCPNGMLCGDAYSSAAQRYFNGLQFSNGVLATN
jgi:hypothetical protein